MREEVRGFLKLSEPEQREYVGKPPEEAWEMLRYLADYSKIGGDWNESK